MSWTWTLERGGRAVVVTLEGGEVRTVTDPRGGIFLREKVEELHARAQSGESFYQGLLSMCGTNPTSANERGGRECVSTIRKAMLDDPPRQVVLGYQRENGEMITRTVEPYELKGGTLFAYCTTDQHIKQFKLDRIRNVERGRAFKPTRPIVIPGA